MVERLLQRLENLLNAGAMILLATMMLLGTADVLGRYLFDQPILGTREISAGYLMVGIVWLSVAHTERLNGHIGVDLVVRNTSERLRGWLAVLGRLLAIIPIALISWKTYEAMILALGQKTRGSIELYVAPSWALVFLGTAMLVLTLSARIAVDVPRLLREGRPWS